ncbi:MAG: adenosylcobinamide-GDP ribazoletransferase [Rhizobiaceae bacterium]
MDNWQVRKAFGDVGACIGFLTRFPQPWVPDPDRRFADALWAAPLVGLLVAVIAALVFGVTLRLGLPTTVAAALAIAAALLATGCLHEDGLADVADGFGGGRTAGDKLTIMRDSRIGTYGVLALVIAHLLKWAALATFLSFATALAALIAAHMASRALMPGFMHLVPRARDDGLAAGIGHVGGTAGAIALALGFLALLLLGFLPAMLAAALLALWVLILRIIAERQIGGQTGDVVGTLQQGGEIIVLLVACVALA